MKRTMNGYHRGVAVLALLLSAVPAAAQTDEDLEVTMEVHDDLIELGDDIPEMRGPRRPADDGDAADEAVSAEAAAAYEVPPAGFGDDFEHDDVNDEFDDNVLDEGDFEDGEQVDEDAFDEETHEDG